MSAGHRRGQRLKFCFFLSAILSFFIAPACRIAAQNAKLDDRSEKLTLSAPSTVSFVAAHGRRSLLAGYPQSGLEMWAYPLQILSGYRIRFKPEGETSSVDGTLLLSRVITNPDSAVRVYTGPDYIVRETLFVPLDRPAAILSYEVDAARPLDIEIQFTPVLDLMWPAALGGQSASWHAELPGYRLTEPAHGLSAVISSPEIVSHDTTHNSTIHPDSSLSFSIRTRAKSGAPAQASVFVMMLPEHNNNAAEAVHELAASKNFLEAEASAHVHELQKTALRIQTPDPDVNSAIAWSEIALDQAWVCNPQLGCGMVAGYGPSRPGRRPQYDWFFAGDGLVATNALIAAGEYERARDELAFIARYQDAKTGMIWHELSQSAGYLDWSKYPYMFVHVDITFDYLNTLARYVAASSDTKYAADHWPSISTAYAYCTSLIDTSDHLPHIPADKEGGDEQHRPADDLSLSTSWVAAARSFAALAEAIGHASLSTDATKQADLASHSIAERYWDITHAFWIDGHTATGEPIFTRRSGPGQALLENIFSAQQNSHVLDEIASSKFQTDWGTRGVATDSSIYDPWSYATGSISALHTAEMASTFWSEHRPAIAWQIWSSLLPWNTLDSPGHLHEVLAGNFYRAQSESVPEQTWSSAGLLESFTRGLLGLDIHGADNSLAFRPHLLAEWDHISLENIRMPHSVLALGMSETINSIGLQITNQGEPVTLTFEPQIPLGAELHEARCSNHPVKVTTSLLEQDEHAKLTVNVPPGITHCELGISNGVSIILPRPSPQTGDTSVAMKLIKEEWKNGILQVDAEIIPHKRNSFLLLTSRTVSEARNAVVHPLGVNRYEIELQNTSGNAEDSAYVPVHVEIRLR